jgi:hypothetical protein
MGKSGTKYLAIGMALAAAAAVPRLASAQAPTVETPLPSALPSRGAVIEQPSPTTQRAPEPGTGVTAPAARSGEAAPLPGLAPAVVPAAAVDPAATTGATPETGVTGSTASSSVLTGWIGGNAVLTIDGTQAGMVRTVTGGTATGVVAVNMVDGAAKKHLSAVRYQDITFEADLGSKPVSDWVAASWKGVAVKKDGSVAGLDLLGNQRVLREFHQAVISETTFPDLEMMSPKQRGLLTVTITPEYTALKPGSGTRATGLSNGGINGFRFEMAGLDGSKVSLIESFTVRSTGAHALGDAKPTVEFPDLKITLPESGAQSWAAWYDDFVVKGNSSEDKERDGALVLLGHTGEMGRVKLFNCGMVGLVPVPLPPALLQSGQAFSPGLRRMTAELYCERMELVMP